MPALRVHIRCPSLLTMSEFLSWCNYFSTSWCTCDIKSQSPVVQSVVSLTSSLSVISLTVLADSIYNILIFFAEKMWVAFALQKLLTFFSKKFQHICVSLDVNFNESLTNDIVSFEQLGPDQHVHPCILIRVFALTFTVELQWLKPRWLVYHGWVEHVLESAGISSKYDKQII